MQLYLYEIKLNYFACGHTQMGWALSNGSPGTILASFGRALRRSSSPYFRANTPRRRFLPATEIRFVWPSGDPSDRASRLFD